MGHITLHMGIGWVLEAAVYIWVTCRTVYGMKEGSSVYGQFSDLGWHEGKICSSGTPLYYTLQRLVATMCKICSMISSDGTPTLLETQIIQAGKRFTKDLMNLAHSHRVVFTNTWFNTKCAKQFRNSYFLWRKCLLKVENFLGKREIPDTNIKQHLIIPPLEEKTSL